MTEVQKIKSLYQGRIFDLFLEKVALPNGVVLEREVVRHPGAAAMVPLLDDDTVILIRQYRHAVDRFLWEIPAGTLEKGESPLACARRELMEEIGYDAARFEKITELLPAPGYTDECIHIFVARDLRVSKQNLDDDEVLETQPVAFSKAIEMIEKGDIQDAKSIVGLLLSRQKRYM